MFRNLARFISIISSGEWLSTSVPAFMCTDCCIIYDKTYLSTITCLAVANVCSRPYLLGSVLKDSFHKTSKRSFRRIVVGLDFVNLN